MSPMFVIQNIRAGLHLVCVCSDFDFIIHKVMFLLCVLVSAPDCFRRYFVTTL